jgi:hypothetical protein
MVVELRSLSTLPLHRMKNTFIRRVLAGISGQWIENYASKPNHKKDLGVALIPS